MEGLSIYIICSKDEGLLGVFVRVLGQTHVCCASARGYLYRFKIRTFTAIPGYFDTVFSLRRRVGVLDCYYGAFQREKKTALRFHKLVSIGENYRYVGTVQFSRWGNVSIICTGIDNDVFVRDTQEIAKSLEGDTPVVL